ncbi:MAG: maltose alpha-D-glucosyltransferase [Chitinivibrionales bacterium]|nr:maltose alpha-D-glucosyltransferase [Chitinivibrionales bacterium]MBD3394973.1 maltose alpha-D-glucosyltransferase [Chitinivibrionales bacterium]
MSLRTDQLGADPLWYKDAVVYEVHVRAFRDSNGDGIGDFKGLIEKLDYLTDLGVTAVWLLPFFPSPLRDDGYDIADYRTIHKDYGSLGDFRQFLKEAHRRGIRVIAELVVNHTSIDHPWFQKARAAKKKSKTRDFYVWSDTADAYADARVIFKDFEASNWSWDPQARAYYWHRFYSHQPDLNFESPAVQKAVTDVMDFWFGMGVDGLRLDAVPYLYEAEGTNCENLPSTHDYLKKLRAHVDRKHSGKMLLAEANQWPEDAVAYFGDGDECHMAFHFPLMPRLFMAVQMEDSYPIIDILKTTPAIPENCQWAMFLRNHDELTLEMVTDEERDYMYRIYAREPRAKINVGIRRRLAPLLGNNRRKMELMNILLMSFPGTPVIYYGDEIGMGDNYYLGDRNGVRTPMQWNADRNAGFSESNPQKLYLPAIIDPEYHYESINVENQRTNLSSPFWWMKRVIAMRKQYQAFSRGDMRFVATNNPKIVAFVRSYEDQEILVVANLSRFSQVVQLELAPYADKVPEELFSHNAFPRISRRPYTLTFGPHTHYWLLLHPRAQRAAAKGPAPATLTVRGGWHEVLRGHALEVLQRRILPRWLYACRWFGAKAKTVRGARIAEDIPLQQAPEGPHLLILQLAYTEGLDEQYLLPLSFASPEAAVRIREEHPAHIICELETADGPGVLYDGSCDPALQAGLFAILAGRRKLKGTAGALAGKPGRMLKKLAGDTVPPPRLFGAEQSNTSIRYGDHLLMKLYRKQDEGVNPETEIVRFLTEKARFQYIPDFAGMLEYHRGDAQPSTLGLLQGWVENVGDAWHFSTETATRYFENITVRRASLTLESAYPVCAAAYDVIDTNPQLLELLGPLFVEMLRLLGRRTAEMHIALASSKGDAAFDPEPFNLLYQRSIYQSMQALVQKNFALLRAQRTSVPAGSRELAGDILDSEKTLLQRMRLVSREKITTVKVRIHGDYHLGQVLYTGKDFVVMDFEGEPARPLSERKLKYSPLKDVAGMLRSLHYAAYAALFLGQSMRPSDKKRLEPWIDPWYELCKRVFLHEYLRRAEGAPFIPKKLRDLHVLLDVFTMEKAVYELGYELNNRPQWVVIPLKGIKNVLSSPE